MAHPGTNEPLSEQQILNAVYDKTGNFLRVSAVAGSLGTSWARDTFLGNGSTSAFTLSNTPVSNSENVYYNGNRQISGTDYSLSGTTVTFLLITPFKGDTIEVQYAY